MLGSGGLDGQTLDGGDRNVNLTVTAGEGSVNVQNKNYNMKKVKLGSQDIQDSQSTKAGGNTME